MLRHPLSSVAQALSPTFDSQFSQISTHRQPFCCQYVIKKICSTHYEN